MKQELPYNLDTERESVRAEIIAAFGDVTRDGGVSWEEARVIDLYGSDHERAAARAAERDSRWLDLVGGEDWDWRQGTGGWVFLDATGFRYYLPAAMTRLLDGCDDDTGLAWSLQLDDRADDSRRFRQWSLLDRRQRMCVRRWLRYLVAYHKAQHVRGEEEWAQVLWSYWEQHAEEPWPASDESEDG